MLDSTCIKKSELLEKCKCQFSFAMEDIHRYTEYSQEDFNVLCIHTLDKEFPKRDIENISGFITGTLTILVMRKPESEQELMTLIKDAHSMGFVYTNRHIGCYEERVTFIYLNDVAKVLPAKILDHEKNVKLYQLEHSLHRAEGSIQNELFDEVMSIHNACINEIEQLILSKRAIDRIIHI